MIIDPVLTQNYFGTIMEHKTCPYLNTQSCTYPIRVDYFTFDFKGQHIWANFKDQAFGHVCFVIREVYAKDVAMVKASCVSTTNYLIIELGN